MLSVPWVVPENACYGHGNPEGLHCDGGGIQRPGRFPHHYEPLLRLRRSHGPDRAVWQGSHPPLQVGYSRVRQMEFGVTHSPADSRAPVQQGVDAEDWGYAIFWVPEFLGLPTLEPFAVLSAVAQRTSTVRLGTAVAGLALRSPISVGEGCCHHRYPIPGSLGTGVGSGGSPTERPGIGRHPESPGAG